MLLRKSIPFGLAALVLAGCAELRDIGCNTVEAACLRSCAGNAQGDDVRLCEDRCLSRNPCRKASPPLMEEKNAGARRVDEIAAWRGTSASPAGPCYGCAEFRDHSEGTR
jgi:hypothetical protein